MRRAVCILALLAASAIFATPVAAQSTSDSNSWFLNAGIGPSFGTFGSTPNVDTMAGYKVSDKLAIAGEFGLVPHAPFEKAASVAPGLTSPDNATASDIHVNGYRVNANLWVTPSSWGKMSPYITGGIGTFTASTVGRFNVGSTSLRRYESDTNFATNVGGGLTYRLNRWFGLNADYRHFIVNADRTQHVNRFATGVSVYVK